MSDAYQTWRTDCRPGDVPVLWAPPGLPRLGPLQVPDGWRVVQPARDPDPYLLNFLAGVAVPPDTKPGPYPVTWKDSGGDGHSLTLTVTKPPGSLKTAEFAPGESADTINKELHSGGVIRFRPGVYDFDRDLVPASDITLDGGGYATLTRSRVGGEYANRLIGLDGGCDDLTVRGFTFANAALDCFTFHGFPGRPKRLTVENCTFENCQAIRLAALEGSSVLFRRCRFRWGAGTGEFPAGTCWDRCLFDGAGAGGWPHAYFNQAAHASLTLSCDWRGTARGMVMQAGPMNCMTVNCTFDGIDGQQTNAGEVIGLEGVGASGNTFLFSRARNCSGPGISLQGSAMRGNYFHGFVLDCRGLSVYLTGPFDGGEPISGNVIVNTECDGTVELSGDCRGNQIAVVCRDFPRSAGNQEPQPWRAGCYGVGLPISDRSATGQNDFGGSFIAVAEGLRPVVKMPRRAGAVETDFMVGEVRPV